MVLQDQKSRKLAEELKYKGGINARKSQQYVCTVSHKEFEDLFRQHVVEDYGSGIWCLTNHDLSLKIIIYELDVSAANEEGRDYIELWI